jgi:hypothetical protein
MSRILLFAGVLLFVVGYLRYFEWRNLYYPTRRIDYTPDAARLTYEDVDFVAEDNCRLHGWWMPIPDARGTVIMLHGNAGNIGDRIWSAADLQRLGLNVFLFDYRGYGKSRGIPTEKGLYRDARAAYEVVRARYDDAEQPPVILYGRSLGGAVAIQLAVDKPVKGIIVESAFTSVVDMGRELYPLLPVSLLCFDRYDSLGKIGDIEVPVLIAHSKQDDLIPFSMGEKLHNAVHGEKVLVPLTGGHNDSGWTTSRDYWTALERFVQRVLGPRPRADTRDAD